MAIARKMKPSLGDVVCVHIAEVRTTKIARLAQDARHWMIGIAWKYRLQVGLGSSGKKWAKNPIMFARRAMRPRYWKHVENDASRAPIKTILPSPG